MLFILPFFILPFQRSAMDIAEGSMGFMCCFESDFKKTKQRKNVQAYTMSYKGFRSDFCIGPL